ncbi:MAG TPA: WecB/TagA/CpsF family glycosyltransferase, partial [Anaeromyxobacteraceae bacterium]
AGVHAAWGVVPGAAALGAGGALAMLAVATLAMPDGLDSLLVPRRRRNRERLAAIGAAGRRLRDAPSIRSINELLSSVAPRLDAEAVRVREAAQLLPANEEGDDRSPARSFLRLDPGCPDARVLEIVWTRSPPLGDDAEIALELLGRHVAASLRRLRPPAREESRGATADILGYETATACREECVQSALDWIAQGDRCRWLACINPHSYVVAKRDAGFADALRGADWLIPDGSGIVLASRLMRRPIRERVTGSDIFFGVNQALERKKGGTVFFLGSTEETLALIGARMQRDFPSVRVVGFHSPPFKASFSQTDLDEMIARINEARPDVLWVGMTAPKQERWLHDNKARLEVKFAAAIGAVFDFYSGRVQRSSPVMQRVGLEWLPRLLREPRRLWRRTFVSAPVFLWDALIAAAARDRTTTEALPLLLTPPPGGQHVTSRPRAASPAVGPTSSHGSHEAHP